MKKYWEDLVSMGMPYLEERGKIEAKTVIKKSTLEAVIVEINDIDGETR